ncbi:MAG: 2-C-methyl-D-erythritol 2,4-cyclodiphosphate synthase [Firmicutes bacterium]|nr:2-C-methyl-D-erythritol 2,4-cyclodiphosphate synthase [Bacillota bacterium]
MGERVGIGFDVHRLVEGRDLILGGVTIPWDKGLDGHSDADVLAHAIMDAILGAAALPDIGRLFPDDYEEYEGISSLLLLERVMDLLAEEGYGVVNVDSTIICEEPKIMPHTEKIRECLAKAMNIPVSCVSVKATTTEKLGFTGRGEGIAAQAICMITDAI